MRKVLIPTDFSTNAMNAIKYAMELFKYDRTDFHIMHAYGDDLYNRNSGMDKGELDDAKVEALKSANEKLNGVIRSMKELAPNPRHKYFSISVLGSLVDEANEIAEQENVDVIVMGTKGKTDKRNITFGSNTLQVMPRSCCTGRVYRYSAFSNSLCNRLYVTLSTEGIKVTEHDRTKLCRQT